MRRSWRCSADQILPYNRQFMQKSPQHYLSCDSMPAVPISQFVYKDPDPGPPCSHCKHQQPHIRFHPRALSSHHYIFLHTPRPNTPTPNIHSRLHHHARLRLHHAAPPNPPHHLGHALLLLRPGRPPRHDGRHDPSGPHQVVLQGNE